MPTALRVTCGIALVGLLAATGSAQTIDKKTLSFEAATKVAAAAEAAARARGGFWRRRRLLSFGGGAGDAQLLHPATESIGVQMEGLRGSAVALDQPV